MFFRIFLAGLLLASAPLPASAQMMGPQFSVNVRGLQMNCTSFAGEPVAIFLDRSLNNVGVATRTYNGAPVIVINPNVTNNFSNIVTQWWFAHECSHHALHPSMNSESNADCLAIRMMRNYGILRHPAQLHQFAYELANLPGSPTGQLPGPARAQHIANCAMS